MTPVRVAAGAAECGVACSPTRRRGRAVLEAIVESAEPGRAVLVGSKEGQR